MNNNADAAKHHLLNKCDLAASVKSAFFHLPKQFLSKKIVSSAIYGIN
jgi:hypothetical protein